MILRFLINLFDIAHDKLVNGFSNLLVFQTKELEKKLEQWFAFDQGSAF